MLPHELSLEYSDGEDEVNYLVFLKGLNWSDLKKLVDEGYNRFWEKDQVCGFDFSGNRIGTGIPRVKPSFVSNNPYEIF